MGRMAVVFLVVALGLMLVLVIILGAETKPTFTDPAAKVWLEAAAAVTKMEGWRIHAVVAEFHGKAEAAQARANEVARSVDFLSPSDSMAVRGVAPSVRWLKHSMLVGLVSFDATAPSYNIDVEVGLRSDGVVVWRAAR